MKQILSLSLDEEIIIYLKRQSADNGRSVSNYVNEHFRVQSIMKQDDEEKGVVEV